MQFQVNPPSLPSLKPELSLPISLGKPQSIEFLEPPDALQKQRQWGRGESL